MHIQKFPSTLLLTLLYLFVYDHDSEDKTSYDINYQKIKKRFINSMTKVTTKKRKV